MSLHDHKADPSILTLEFAAPLQYFGFAWLSGTEGNQITAYSGYTVLFTLNNEDIFSRLNSDYNADSQGTSGADANFPYAYLLIFADGSEGFDKVVFEQLVDDEHPNNQLLSV